MPDCRSLLGAGLVVGLLLASPEAEARFGKRSPPSEPGNGGEKQREPSPPPKSDDSLGANNGMHCPQGGSVQDPVCSYKYEPRPYTPDTSAPTQDRSEARAVARARDSGLPSTLRLNADGGGMGHGAVVGVLLGVERGWLGLSARASFLALPDDEGSQQTDNISLMEAHLTVALWSSQNVRLRMEGGLGHARAPDLHILGPSLATSLNATLVSGLDFEARAQAVPLPYRQLDAQAGLALRTNEFSLRGGWRTLVLDDAGLVDGVRHVDVLSGPYLGVGLSF